MLVAEAVIEPPTINKVRRTNRLIQPRCVTMIAPCLYNSAVAVVDSWAFSRQGPKDMPR